MRHPPKLAALALLFNSPASAQMTEAEQLEAARNIASLIQLSPAGTKLWACQSLKRTAKEKLNDIKFVEIEIGHELARPSPDRHRLDALIEQYAAKAAAIERDRKRSEIDDAFQLSPADRQRLGQFIERHAQHSANK